MTMRRIEIIIRKRELTLIQKEIQDIMTIIKLKIIVRNGVYFYPEEDARHHDDEESCDYC
jgi:hypothetical protein